MHNYLVRLFSLWLLLAGAVWACSALTSRADDDEGALRYGEIAGRAPFEAWGVEEATAVPLGFPATFLADADVVQLIFGETRELIDA